MNRNHMMALGLSVAITVATGVVDRSIASETSESVTVKSDRIAPDLMLHDAIRNALGVDRYSLQPLKLGSVNGGQTVEVRLDGDAAMLNVAPHSVRSTTFRWITSDANGAPVDSPPPPPTTFRGSIENQPGSRVVATITDGQLTAFIRDANGREWLVQPLDDIVNNSPPTTHIVINVEDVSDDRFRCPVNDETLPTIPAGAPRGVNTSCEPIVVKLAIVADFEYWQYNGSSNANTTAAIEAAIDLTSFIYEEQLGITYEIEQIIIWNGGNQITPVFVGAEVDSNPLLDDLRDWYNANHAGIDRRYCHLFSGLDFVGGNVGRAYTGVPCIVASGYGVNQMNRPLLSGVKTLAHELGHNWGASHCDGFGGCDIMYSNGFFALRLTFGSTTTNSIVGAGAPLYACITPAVNPGVDCNHNGLCDSDEIAMGTASDANGTGVPDECERIYNMTQATYYPRIMLAVDAANIGDVIEVAPGIYPESVNDLGKALTIRSTGGRDVTTIDVTGLGAAGVILTGGTLEGFTVQGTTQGSYSNAGAGIEVPSGSPIINQCLVKDNMLAPGLIGGGALFNAGSSATVSNTIFCNNAPSNTLGLYTNGGGNTFPASCPVVQMCGSTLGDVNEDGSIDGGDISSFVECFIDGSTTNGDCLCADLATGGGVDASDLGLFVDLLLTQ